VAADTCWTSLKPASRASASISAGAKRLMKGVLGEGIQTCAEDDILSDPTVGFFSDGILDEASTGQDGCSEWACEPRVHVRAAAPIIFWGDQPQADLVFEHMRRRVDPDMHCPPQGDPHRCAVWRRSLLIMHVFLFLLDKGLNLHRATGSFGF
jgi:hypothetical protein